jgi:tetratricopeptide (TPR) repeat protein
VSVDASIDPGGKWSARQRESYSGDFEVPIRNGLRLVPRAQWTSRFERALRFEQRGRESLPEGLEIDADDPAATREPFEIRSRYTLATFADLSGGQSVLRLPTSVGGLPSSEDLATTPGGELLVQGPFTMRYQARIELPSDWKPKPTETVTAKEDFGEYRSSYSFEGRMLSVDRSVTINRRSLPADQAGTYDRWRARIAADSQSGLVLEKAAPAPVAPLAGAEEARKHYEAGVAAHKDRRYRSAVTSLKKAVELAPDHKDAWAVLGRAHLDQRETDLAVTALRRQIELVPAHFEAHRDLGSALWAARRHADAENEFARALEIRPEDPYTRWRLGALYLGRHRNAEAVAELTKAAAKDDKNARLQVDLGEALLAVGNDDKAFAALDAAVMLRPDPPTWNDAAWSLAIAGKRLERAQEWAESAVVTTAARLRSVVPETLAESHASMTRSLASYWDTLGWIHFRRGDWQASEPYLRAAFSLSPEGEIADHLRQLRERRSGTDSPAQLSLAARLSAPSNCSAQCNAGLFLALSSGGKVVAAKLAVGDVALEPVAKSLIGLGHDLRFPDAMPTQAIVSASLTCPRTGDCRLDIGTRAVPQASAPPASR